MMEADAVSTAGGLFTGLDGSRLAEGSIYTLLNGPSFSISYAGGDGNDIALIAVPEPGVVGAFLGGLGIVAGLRRRRI
jgi:hypothetical protein